MMAVRRRVQINLHVRWRVETAWWRQGMAEEIKLEKVGESISHHVLRTREMDKITGKLRQIGHLALLSGGTSRDYPEQSICQRFVISE